MIKCPICGEEIKPYGSHPGPASPCKSKEHWGLLAHLRDEHEPAAQWSQCVCGFAADLTEKNVGIMPLSYLVGQHLGNLTEEEFREHFNLVQLGATFSD